MDLKRMFALAVGRTPDKEAVVDGVRRYTYGEWATRVYALANSLLSLGLKKGDRVGMVLKNREETATAIMATQVAGLVAVPVNPRTGARGTAYILKDSGARAVIFEEVTSAATEEAAESVAECKILISIDGKYTAQGVLEFNELLQRGEPEEPAVDVRGEDVGQIIYTSGTTGEPKGVPVTHEASLFRVYCIDLHHGLRLGDEHRIIGLMPLFHTVGLHAVFLNSVSLNGTYYPVADFVPAQVIDLIEREKITLLYGAPTHFYMILEDPTFQRERVQSVRDALFSGAPMTEVLHKRVAREICENLTNIYGNTETYNSLWYRRAWERPGALVPGVFHSTRIVKPGGRPDEQVGPGEEGELIVDMRSPEAFSGYWNKPDKTAEKVKYGWYYTGDVYYVHPDGAVSYSGRVDDMILTGGENVHPTEVEDVLAKHPQVADVAVVGLPDDRWGQAVTAFIVPRSKELTAEELDRFCRESKELDTWKRPRRYEFVESIPRNPSGKIMRYVLRDQYGK